MITLGIDLGGTAIKGGLLSSDGRILARASLPTPPEGGAAVIEQIGRLADELSARARPRRLGIGVPGPIAPGGQRVMEVPNIPGMTGCPVVRLVGRRTGLPVTLENDANCAGVGEFHSGAGRGSRTMILFTLGTGIGGAVIIDGKLWGAGELGHLPVVAGGRRCGCGVAGCLEAYGSALALGKATGRPPRAKEIFDAARRGDRRAARAVEEACAMLGAAVAGLVHTLQPDVFVLSGGMAAAGSSLLRRVRDHARARVFSQFRPGIRVVKGTLGSDAGWIGAAVLARRS